MTLPERIRTLEVDANGAECGQLTRASRYVFTYRRDDPRQPAVGLLMPASTLVYEDGALFPVMDQNLPEGYLFERIRAAYPKQQLTPMHLLALMGTNAIGRIGYRLPDTVVPAAPPRHVDRSEILRAPASDALFDDLVRAYLLTGIGLAGVQPKIMVPDRATLAVPNLIVKSAGSSYPGLAANEFMCLNVARHAGMRVPSFELSDSGELLVLERFDVLPDGSRLGFEDVAALMGLQVHDIHHGERKYLGSYERVVEVLRLVNVSHEDIARFYEQLTLSIMVRNGDAHLKNFGVLYTDAHDVRLSPLYDVVTTSIYAFERAPGGPLVEDRTLALKLFRGRRGSRAYPTTEELLRFGSEVCGVRQPQGVIDRIASAMVAALDEARTDARVPNQLVAKMADAWQHGLAHATRK